MYLRVRCGRVNERARDAIGRLDVQGSQQVRARMLRAITYLVILVSVFGVSGCDETREAYYPTYEAAVSAGVPLAAKRWPR